MGGVVRLGGALIACAVFQVLLVLQPEGTPVVPAWPLLLRPTYELLGPTGGLMAAGIPALHIVSLSIALMLCRAAGPAPRTR